VALLTIATVAISMEQDIKYYQMYEVILACTIWRAVITLLGTMKLPKLFTNSVNFTYVHIVIYLFYHTLGRGQMSHNNVLFLVDNVKPYVQYRTTINWAAHECLCLCQFIWNLMVILKVKVAHFGALIVCLSVCTCVAILLFEPMLVMQWDIIERFRATDTFDEMFHGGSEDLNLSYHNRFVQEQRTYYANNNGKYQLGHYDIRGRSEEIVFKQQILRYKGENAQFQCGGRYSFNETKSQSTFFKLGMRWTFIGMDLRNGSRHIISSNHSISSDGSSAIVDSSLTIKGISTRDSGLYRCFDQRQVYAKTETFNKPLLIITRNLTGIFLLKVLQRRLRTRKVDVGRLILTYHFYWHHEMDDVLDVSPEYTINGVPVENVCPGPGMGSCSIGTNLDAFFTPGKDFLKWDNVGPYVDTDANILFHTIRSKFCLCNKGFGVHKVILHRRGDLDGIEHPYVDVVLPDSQYLFWNFNDEHLYGDIEAMVDNGTELSIIQAEINRIHAFMTANEEKGLALVNLVDRCLIIISLVNLFLHLHIIFTVHIPNAIQITTRNNLLHLTDRDVIEDANYDVFVSHSEGEYEFVTKVLVPFLQNNGQRKVSYSSDAMHGQPNQFLLTFYEDLILNSKKIIVLLSKDYNEDALCYYTQLKLIIVPLLYENKIKGKSVLFIKFDDHARLPDILWHLDVEIIPWQNHLSDAVKLQFVKRWLYTGKV